MREHADPNLTCILVGNKVDLCEESGGGRQRQVTAEEGEAFAKEHGLLFVESSAKSGQNVELAFFTASRDILDKVKRGVFDQGRVRHERIVNASIGLANICLCSLPVSSQLRPETVLCRWTLLP